MACCIWLACPALGNGWIVDTASNPATSSLLTQQVHQLPQPNGLHPMAQGDALMPWVHHVTLRYLQVVASNRKAFFRAGRHGALDLNRNLGLANSFQHQVYFSPDLGAVKVGHAALPCGLDQVLDAMALKAVAAHRVTKQFVQCFQLQQAVQQAAVAQEGFSKSAFSVTLSAHGIAYLHAPTLVCPKPIRNPYKTDSNWQTCTREFLKYIQTQQASLPELVKIAQVPRPVWCVLRRTMPPATAPMMPARRASLAGRR